MEIIVKVINAFSVNGTGGNPAGVVLDADQLGNATKQLIAARAGFNETAFVSHSSIAGYKLDFFTPVKQIAHCGHATIATFSYLKQKGFIKADRSSKETIDGIRNIYFKDGEAYMEQAKPYFQPLNDDELQKIFTALGLTEKDLQPGLEPCIVNTGNSFLVVPVKNETILQNIQPQQEMIRSFSEEFNLVGFYPYSPAEENLFDATTRMFAPLYGIEEESATGMAAGPLAAYLYKYVSQRKQVLIQQGKFMSPPSKSLIKVNLDINESGILNLYAGGNAFTSIEMLVII